MTGYKVGAEVQFGADVLRAAQSGELRAVMENYWRVECYAPDGTLRWVDTFANLITNVGLNDLLDKYLKGSSYTAAFYVGLTAASPTFAAGDTMSSHAGWTEFTAYDEATREALTLGTVSSQSVSNTASKASFTVSTDSSSVGGAFLTTDDTKGGTSGTIYGGAAFDGGNKAADDGDTLNVTVTLTAASA